MRPSTTPGEDVIFNGANDDASGTAGVIELAYALKGYKPKRSIVFVCFYGEERGLLGSRYYGSHPVIPAKDTVAMVNLEQIGRTDDLEGARVGGGSLNGYDFSDVGLIMTAAGTATGVKVDKHPQNSDAFFGRSDNQAMADLGVPAHTLCTAFTYPDYHKAGDHWDKLDYANMEKVVKMVGLSVMSIADSAKRPQWNVSNTKTAKYVEAAKKLVGQ
jgi:Zn-dependent M28 family amino/carboxypeptidase